MNAQSRYRFSRRAVLLTGGAALVGGLIARPGLAQSPTARSDAELTARLQDLRSLREIRGLQHSWGHLAEGGRWSDMAALFASAGVWTDGSRTVEGPAAIGAFLRDTMGGGSDGLPPGRLNLRLFLTPVITLADDGRTARGRWHEVAMTGQTGASADWAGGIHVVDYVRDGSGWKIARMHYHPQYAGGYEEGWRSVAPLVGKVAYHYTPDQAGTPVPRGRSAEALPANELAAGADLVLASSLAQNLVAAYGFYLDRQMHQDIADLFTTDGSIEIAGSGRKSGRDGVLEALRTFGEPDLDEGELNDRPQLMPVVNVAADGRSARLRNIEIGMTGRHGGETFWSATVQEFDLVRGDDGWRIRSFRFNQKYVTGNLTLGS